MRYVKRYCSTRLESKDRRSTGCILHALGRSILVMWMVDFDPTNQLVEVRHIAWRWDATMPSCAPPRGVYKGEAESTLSHRDGCAGEFVAPESCPANCDSFKPPLGPPEFLPRTTTAIASAQRATGARSLLTRNGSVRCYCRGIVAQLEVQAGFAGRGH